MKKTNVGIASVLAASMLLSGCGLSVNENGAENINVSELIDDAFTIINDINGVPNTEPAEETADDAELKEVQAVVDRYIKAVKESDAQGIVDTTDLEMVTYIFSGKQSSVEDLLEKGHEALEEIGAAWTADGSTDFIAEELTCRNSEAAEINSYLSSPMLSKAPQDAADKYQIDGAYSFKMTVRNKDNCTESELGGSYTPDEEWNTDTEEYTSDEIVIDTNTIYSAVQDMTRSVANISFDTYVLHINGEWVVDAGQFVTVAKMYNMFQCFGVQK